MEKVKTIKMCEKKGAEPDLSAVDIKAQIQGRGGAEGSDPDLMDSTKLKCFQDWNLVVPRRPMTQFNLFQKERETKPTPRGQGMKREPKNLS